MTLISTKWINYLHENEEIITLLKENLFPTLYEFELKRFTFELDEGYRGTDAALEVFPRYLLTYQVSYEGKEVLVEIATGASSSVQLDNETNSFSDYFGLTAVQSNELEEFFHTFGQLLLRM